MTAPTPIAPVAPVTGIARAAALDTVRATASTVQNMWCQYQEAVEARNDAFLHAHRCGATLDDIYYTLADAGLLTPRQHIMAGLNLSMSRERNTLNDHTD